MRHGSLALTLDTYGFALEVDWENAPASVRERGMIGELSLHSYWPVASTFPAGVHAMCIASVRPGAWRRSLAAQAGLAAIRRVW
ncbi:hypothetical protein [Streptomyces sp. NPDC005538]|uniref:hypothetical protein n=1 Tax=unclassified Streptomyces TaxID=2593676 RepID=UPI0033B680CC